MCSHLEHSALHHPTAKAKAKFRIQTQAMDEFNYYWDDPYPYQALILPQELLLAILECLEKKDLKQVRLVSKLWCPVATELLFDRIYFSAHEKDLDVFNKIGGHPLLRKAVRELVYDTTTFRDPPNYDAYYDIQAAEMRLLASDWCETPFTYPDAEVESYIEDLKSPSYRRPGPGSPDGIYVKHKDDRFL